MTDSVETHYHNRAGDLTNAIAGSLEKAGVDTSALSTADLSSVDEFHIRGREATLQLAEHMKLAMASSVLDMGSGLGGPARTLAEAYGCHVTGVDLTPAFCDAAEAMSKWVGLSDRVTFRQGDATNLPFPANSFDAAMTIHVAMNIPAKDRMYSEAFRVLRPGGVFAVYDVLQGEGGEVLYPVPWARQPAISHLATPQAMRTLLTEAGFELLDELDTTAESQQWFEAMVARLAQSGPTPLSFQIFLGDDFPDMARNQIRNLTERRIRTVSYICRT